MNPQNPDRLFDPTINATTAPSDSFKSDSAARTGIYSPIPNIQYAYHTAASCETSKAWVAAAAQYRKVDDDDMWRRIHKGVWSVAPIPQPVGLTEEEKKKVFDQLCNTERQKLKLDQVQEARAKENERQRDLFLKNNKSREGTQGKQRSECRSALSTTSGSAANVGLNPGSKQHDIPNIIVGEDLWKDVRRG